jgi:hypothetical protein
MIKPNCEKLISIFNLSSNEKNYSNFDISPHLRFEKICFQEIPLIKGFPTIPRTHPNFLK